MFQSTPAIADGRTARPRGNGAGMQAFQSTPAIADGRTQRAAVLRALGELFQSTPAIADGRTAASARRSCRRAGRFNPRPPSLTGEPKHWTLTISKADVSIHARHR